MKRVGRSDRSSLAAMTRGGDGSVMVSPVLPMKLCRAKGQEMTLRSKALRSGSGRLLTVWAGLWWWLVGRAGRWVSFSTRWRSSLVAAAWTRPYSLKSNYISDLGNTACGMFHVPHGTPYYVCSPDHGLMNASFALLGVLTIAGALLLRRIWPAGHLASWALALWILSGIGKIIVGLVPENTHIGLHLLGALNVPLGSIAILLLSLAIRRTSRALSNDRDRGRGGRARRQLPVHGRGIRRLVAVSGAGRRRRGAPWPAIRAACGCS